MKLGKTFIGIVLLLMCQSKWTSTAVAQETECVEPDNFEELKADLNADKILDSFLNIPMYAEGFQGLAELKANPRTSRYVNPIREIFYGRDRCVPFLRAYRGQGRTTCPWIYVKNTDENRYPRTVVEAKCVCEHCLDFLNERRTLNRCKPVPNNIRVLRRIGCQSGYYVYAVTVENVPTGCTCASHVEQSELNPMGGPYALNHR